MSNQIVIIGNLGKDPEIRISQAGNPVANFSVCDTPSRYNKDTQQYEDGEPFWQYCRAFKHLAEHVGQSLKKGHRVIVVGRIETNKWVDQQTGEQREMNVLLVDSVGPDLTFGTTAFTKSAPAHSGPPADGENWASQRSPQPQPQDNAWGQAPQGGFGGGNDAEVPF